MRCRFHKLACISTRPRTLLKPRAMPYCKRLFVTRNWDGRIESEQHQSKCGSHYDIPAILSNDYSGRLLEKPTLVKAP